MRLERGCNSTQRPVLPVAVGSLCSLTPMMAEGVIMTFGIAQLIKHPPMQGVVLSGRKRSRIGPGPALWSI